MATIATPRPGLTAPRPSSAPSVKLEELLENAGILVNGPLPWDMRIHTPGVLEHIASHGSLALGESYVAGEWDAEQLDEFFARILRTHLDREARPWSLLLPVLRDRLFNRQNTRRAWQVGKAHYDLGNDFYQAMLGRVMAYSCGYWKTATTLEEAQEAKLDLACRKLDLKPGMRVLDIGCGWGAFIAHAARHYGVQCVGVTISKEQAAFVRERYAGLPLEVRLEDYRDLHGHFDRIVSIGMRGRK